MASMDTKPRRNQAKPSTIDLYLGATPGTAALQQQHHGHWFEALAALRREAKAGRATTVAGPDGVSWYWTKKPTRRQP